MNLTIAPDTSIVASPDAIMSDVDGEIMLICVTSGRYFGLDQVGSEIWRRIQQPVRFGELSQGLQTYFKGDSELIDREAMTFVTRLADRGLVIPA